MIKNIIFDVGEVLVGYRWKDMLMFDHGLSEERAVDVAMKAFGSEDVWRDSFDGGLMNEEEVIAEYQRRFPDEGDDIEWFIRNGELMSVDRPEIWELVRKLKKSGYKIYVLSNYSKVLYDKHTKNANFPELLDGEVVSYQVKCVKPNVGIYNALLQKYNLNPKECLFFDDKKENIEAGEKLGIKGIQVTSEDMLKDTLTRMIGGESV